MMYEIVVTHLYNRETYSVYETSGYSYRHVKAFKTRQAAEKWIAKHTY